MVIPEVELSESYRFWVSFSNRSSLASSLRPYTCETFTHMSFPRRRPKPAHGRVACGPHFHLYFSLSQHTDVREKVWSRGTEEGPFRIPFCSRRKSFVSHLGVLLARWILLYWPVTIDSDNIIDKLLRVEQNSDFRSRTMCIARPQVFSTVKLYPFLCSEFSYCLCFVLTAIVSERTVKRGEGKYRWRLRACLRRIHHYLWRLMRPVPSYACLDERR